MPLVGEVSDVSLDLLVDDGTWGNLAGSMTDRAHLLSVDLRYRADPLPCYLHETEFGKRQDIVLGAVAFHQVVLSDSGLCDSATGIHGWQFEWGSTGFCPLGDGLYYISHSGVADGSNYCNAVLYRWNGSPEQAFDQVIR